MPIDAKLFAHIENDAALSGTFDLQGNNFELTVKYLTDYINKKLKDKSAPPHYVELLQSMKHLVRIEKKINKLFSSSDLILMVFEIAKVAEKLEETLCNLPLGGKLLLPGGWKSREGGHAIVYQLTRDDQSSNFIFTVINSGAGLEFHSKQSRPNKEFFNPMKSWSFPSPRTSKEHKEISLFFERLLQARCGLINGDRIKPITSSVLYQEIFSTISYIYGEELPIDEPLPPYVYTQGQLSGTCSQRSLHQMLKINSASQEEYTLFIFKFKQHALFDYAAQCLAGKQPFNETVRKQIYLAMHNNLKLLKELTMSEVDKRIYREQVEKLKEKVSQASMPLPPRGQAVIQSIAKFTINHPVLSPSQMNIGQFAYDRIVPPVVDFQQGTSFLLNLNQAIQDMNGLIDAATRYLYLEKIILALPIGKDGQLDLEFFKELETEKDMVDFERHLQALQDELFCLRETWLSNAEIPSLNVITFALIALQMQAHEAARELKARSYFSYTTYIHAYAKWSSLKNFPSFKAFDDEVWVSIVGNHARNPFLATNNPELDEKFLALQALALKKRNQIANNFGNNANYYAFVKKILANESSLDSQLKEEYRKRFALDRSKLHEDIRRHGLESLFMIAEHLKGKLPLDKRFDPIIKEISAHIEYESKIAKAIDPFFKDKTNDFTPRVDFQVSKKGVFHVHTSLLCTVTCGRELSTHITENKYALNDPSAARDALLSDISNNSIFLNKVFVITANEIQLKSNTASSSDMALAVVRDSDMIARDYYHLRLNPNYQVPLTLDYFTRHVERLSDEALQRYVEANIFQPGLLQNASKNSSFIPQFDHFLETGHRYFMKVGQHTRASLFFIRQNFLVSRYLCLSKDPTGLLRLEQIQNELERQLLLPNEPDVTFVLQEYLFLTIMARIESKGLVPSEAVFKQVFHAYFYLNSHTNPLILEDTSHGVELACEVAKFQCLVRAQSQDCILNTVEGVLRTEKCMGASDTLLSQQFPVLEVFDSQNQPQYQVNVILGKLFEKGLARSGLPLVLKNHPLIQQLGLQNVQECSMNVNKTYFILQVDGREVRLFCIYARLIIQKDWLVQGQSYGYELQALTPNHEAQLANWMMAPMTTTLPRILIDGSMNYWQSETIADSGLLVQDNVPIYSIRGDKIKVLNEQCNETDYELVSYDPQLSPIFSAFESHDFIIIHASPSHTRIMLPRFDLAFEVNATGLVHHETKESVIACVSPIHPDVAGLVLQKGTASRYLVPVARFYATSVKAIQGGEYPVIHDMNGTIADVCLSEQWKKRPPLSTPLWHYQNSEHYVSFRLKDGEPVADNVADSLYLAYIYLATDQTEKAWKTLEDCKTRLGGLTGDPAELKYISWIVNESPHVLLTQQNKEEREKPIRKTVNYVACQLKAMSLVCDYLWLDGHFDLKKPEVSSHKTANEEYALLEHEKLEEFINALPDTIYHAFTRYQIMDRNTPYYHQLNISERKHLLNYYHQSNPDVPKGALGYEWMCLRLQSIQEERHALIAQQVSGQLLPKTLEKRLKLIERRLATLDNVMALSSSLEALPIDLTLPKDSVINGTHLSLHIQGVLAAWNNKLPGPLLSSLELEQAITNLLSNRNESEFILDFTAYFQVACSSQENLRDALLLFCQQTLLANRHVSLTNQESNIPLLCNVLYRILTAGKELKVLLPTIASPCTFSALVGIVSDFVVPPLVVREAKDVYREILATPKDIQGALKVMAHKTLITSKASSKPLIVELRIDEHLKTVLSDKKRIFDDFLGEYQSVQASTLQDITRLSSIPTESIDKAYELETRVGKLLWDLEIRKQALAHQFMQDPALVHGVLDAAKLSLVQLNKEREQAWREALDFANKGPEDPKQAEAWAIEKESLARGSLTKATLMLIYTQADCALAIEKTGFSREEDAQKLHDFIHKALVLGIQCDAVEKIESHFNKALLQPQKAIMVDSAVVQALDVLATREIPDLDKPAIVLLQHQEHLLLRSRQKSALESLLKVPEDGTLFHETVEKIIMGGGKSKVILPILAEKKAQGDNLVVVEVPQALLATNYVDLNASSQRLYGKFAYQFEFNRDSDCSPQQLQKLYQHFIDIITTRGYLVTAAESIQSLELKYLELLLTEGKRDESWKAQVLWLDKITSLFRDHADVIIDEVHQGLLIMKKLSYTAGESKTISPSLIENSVYLYSLISSDFIKEAASFTVDHDWTEFKLDLATRLVKQPPHCLKPLMESLCLTTDNGEQQLIDYLLNKPDSLTQAMHDTISKASSEVKEALAYFKQQITVLLPETLTHRLDEKYGASKQNGLTAIEETLAIPYAGSNVPNERSRFGNVLEAMNYTIQMMLLKGISQALLEAYFLELQSLAHQELFESKMQNLEDTPTARGFAAFCRDCNLSGITLTQIDVKNDNQMASFHQIFGHNRSLIHKILQTQSLKKIHYDTATIQSDSFNHVDLYRSVQGVSGTPSNHTTYHQRLHYDKNSSFGTDGSIIQMVIEKNTPVIAQNYQNVLQFVAGIFSKLPEPDRSRAIIDISATFQGVSNVEVAREIAKYILSSRDHFSSPIQHVLYFNEDKVLCAIDIENPEVPIQLASTDIDKINQKLGSNPDNRFTYYDQSHAIGIDIKQDEQAQGVVLADAKSSLQNFLQGSMRMRDLSQGQTIAVIVPKEEPLPELIERFRKSDEKRLLMDNIVAAKAQMINLLRRQCLSLIQALDSEDAEGKWKLTQHFRPFFEEISSTNLFDLYGAISKKQTTVEILNACRSRVLKLMHECLEKARLNLSLSEQHQIEGRLQDIIDKALPHCSEFYEGFDDSLSKVVEVQKEVQKEVEQQVLKQNACYDPKLIPAVRRPWRVPPDLIYSEDMTWGLNHIVHAADSDFFSKNLRASKNYAETYAGQKDYVGPFIKPVFLILYSIKNGVLHALIVTPEEADELKEIARPDSWLSTLDDTLIWGKRDDAILERVDYQSLREQVRFFNGDLDMLLNQKVPLCWLKEKWDEKIAFFEQNLLPFRPGSGSSLQQLKNALAGSLEKGFRYIAEHSFEDLSDYDWTIENSNVVPAVIFEYQNLANVFKEINQNWMSTEALSVVKLQRKYNLPMSSLSYVEEHLEHLSILKSLLNRLPELSLIKPLLVQLTGPEKTCLEKCFRCPLERMYEKYGVNQEALVMELASPLTLPWRFAETHVLVGLQGYLGLLDTKNPIVQRLTLIQFHMSVIKTVNSIQDVRNLYALLEHSKLDEFFYLAISRHKQCDDGLIIALLNLSWEKDPETWIALAHQCRTAASVELLLIKCHLLDAFLMISDGPQSLYLTSEALSIFNQLANNPVLSPEMAQAILNRLEDDKCSLEVLITLTERVLKRLSSPEYIDKTEDWDSFFAQVFQRFSNVGAFEILRSILEGQPLNARVKASLDAVANPALLQQDTGYGRFFENSQATTTSLKPDVLDPKAIASALPRPGTGNGNQED